MPEVGFGVISSPTRLKIYQTLLRNPMSTNQLAQSLGLSHSSLRFHLRDLESSGLVTRRTETTKGRGRPKIIWTVDKGVHIDGFPVRRYEQLSEILLRTLIHLAGDEEVGTTLLHVGRELGAEALREISQSKSVSSWTPESFCEHFIIGSMERGGIVIDIERCSESEVVFSNYNCPFQELTVRYKDEICDNLDKGYYQGIAEAMGGGARFERTACLADGDDMCSYVLTWGRGGSVRPERLAASS